jgi:RHS repeat-associated protein
VRFASYGYNTLSQRIGIGYGPVQFRGPNLASTALTFTPGGQVATMAYTFSGSSLTLGYGYNQDHQRTSLTASDASYLPSGLTPSSASYTTNALNQYAKVNGTSFSYDGNGNLTSDGVWTYGYDTENRLVSASTTGTTVSYGYDALGRRLAKTVNGLTTEWLSFGNQEIAEFQGTSSVSFSRAFVNGPGLDEPLASIDPTNTRTYHFADAQGSVIALGNASGQVTERYAYTGYGLTVATGANTAAYRYTGRRFDAETGLYFYRARAYSPTLGRFLQTDPIGTQGGVNLYAYVNNDPLNNTDPDGTCGPACLAAALAAGGAITGVAVQFVVDVTVNGQLSSPGQYVSAGLSGAALGLSVVPGGGELAALAIKFGGGAGFSAVGSTAGQLIDDQPVDVVKVAVDAIVGGATALIPGPAFGGLTAGRNSFSAIADSTITKFANETIEDISTQTLGKATTGLSAKSVYGDLASSLFDSTVGGSAIGKAK